MRFDFSFSGIDTFLTIAGCAAILAIVLFLGYAGLQVVQIRNEEETPALRAIRLVYYCVCVLTVILIFVAVNNMGGGFEVLEYSWYFAAALCIVGLILSLKSALLNNKTALIAITVLVGVCLILFFIFCLGSSSASGKSAASAANDIRNGIVSDITSQLPNIDTGNNNGNSGNGGNGGNGDNGNSYSGYNGGGNVNNGTVSVGDYVGR